LDFGWREKQKEKKQPKPRVMGRRGAFRTETIKQRKSGIEEQDQKKGKHKEVKERRRKGFQKMAVGVNRCSKGGKKKGQQAELEVRGLSSTRCRRSRTRDENGVMRVGEKGKEVKSKLMKRKIATTPLGWTLGRRLAVAKKWTGKWKGKGDSE